MEKVNCTTCGTENPVNYKYCFSCGYELPKIKTEILDNTIQQKPSEKADKRNKITGIIVGAIFFALSYYAVQQLFFKTPTFDKAMMEMASELNKTCPIMVDAETRLDNAVSLPKKVFQYNNTLVNVEKETANTEEMQKFLEPNIVNLVKTNPQMKPMRDLKTTINYYYKDKDGTFLFLISLTPDNYE
jgi:hypothetical protein